MASTSSVQNSFKYDVFLSFRGEDTRKTFVDHLYHALHQRGITTYKDDERIEKGKRISEQLMRSIEESRFHIIVFSKNYASSSWCLHELVKIMECQRTTEQQTAYPIFYDVEPTEVRKQSGAVREAFAENVVKEGAGSWRDALKEAAGLAGWELKNTVDGHEAKFIEKIMEEILPKLYFINMSIDENLVGMEIRVNKIVSSLGIGLDDVQMIGIKGMGGGGKTTLARTVFDHISYRFEGKSFVENVREGSKGSGLKELQKQVLKDVSNDQSIDVKSVYDGKNMMKRIMHSRKVLVVLDDVDDIDQLKALAGEPTWFKPGSKIIITTRDKQVLVAHGVHSDNIHDVNLLSNEEAICLFSRCAFKRETPIQEYKELSKKVVHYAKGLPLTITVLGSFLCGRAVCEWEDALERLNSIPEDQTLKVLELSYNGLENDYKEIFLDVACILRGESKDDAVRMLESCGFKAQIGLSVLEQKSLITISYDNCLQLHDLIVEMGRNIVRHVHPDEPSRHSRLWIKEEIEDILVNESGTEDTKCIKMKYSKLHSTIVMKGLRKMKELRFLFLLCFRAEETDEVAQYLPNSLRFLCWYSYPFSCLSKTFQANKLVNLDMVESNVSQLWEGGERKVLNNLKFIDLRYSKLRTFDLECPKLKFLNLSFSMVRNLNLGMSPSLEELHLNGCKDFVELRMPVECSKLRLLNLSCSKVSSLNLGMSPSLEELHLDGCEDFGELRMPVECSKLRLLNLSCSKVSNLNLGMFLSLEELHLDRCEDFGELRMPVECSKLRLLNLSCSKVSSLNLGMSPSLEELHLDGCEDFGELRMPVECSKLRLLNLSCSKVSNLNLGMFPSLENLHLAECEDFVELHLPVECSKLRLLNLSCSKVSNLNLGMFPSLENLHLAECEDFVELHLPVECPKLEALYLTGCNDFVELHMPVECPKLKVLDLSGSKVSNLNLELTPRLEKLYLRGCEVFVELNMPVKCTKLNILDLSGSKVSNLNLGMSPSLEGLHLEECKDFVELHMPVECPKLVVLNLSGSKVSNLNLGMTPSLMELSLAYCEEFVQLHIPVECPNLYLLHLNGSKVSNLNLGMFPSLEKVSLENCEDFGELRMPVECSKLKFLNLSGSKVSNLNLGMTPSLEALYLTGCNDFVELHMPVECPKLKVLDLNGSKVSNLYLELTPRLEKLYLTQCYNLGKIHAPMGCLKMLIHFNLSHSSYVEDFLVKEWLRGVASVERLKVTAESLDVCSLHPNNNLPKFWFKGFYSETISSSSGDHEKIFSFGICACTSLESFSATICGLQGLKKLRLEYTIPELPKNLYQLECLEELSLSVKEIKHLPDSICMLKQLKYLNLKSCLLLEMLPKDLGRLESLEELHLTDCIFLREIPNSVCNMNCLKSLDLRFCILFEKLPEEFGRLESLEEINIEGAAIRHLPLSIFQLKGLCIIGSTWRLESYGFTSLRNISRYTASCYIRDSQHDSLGIQEANSQTSMDLS